MEELELSHPVDENVKWYSPVGNGLEHDPIHVIYKPFQKTQKQGNFFNSFYDAGINSLEDYKKTISQSNF